MDRHCHGIHDIILLCGSNDLSIKVLVDRYRGTGLGDDIVIKTGQFKYTSYWVTFFINYSYRYQTVANKVEVSLHHHYCSGL